MPEIFVDQMPNHLKIIALIIGVPTGVSLFLLLKNKFIKANRGIIEGESILKYIKKGE